MNIEEHTPLGLEPPASNKSGWFVFAGYDKDGNDFYLHGDGIIRNSTGHNGRSLGYFPSSEEAEVARQAWLRENNLDIKQAAEENARLRKANRQLAGLASPVKKQVKGGCWEKQKQWEHYEKWYVVSSIDGGVHLWPDGTLRPGPVHWYVTEAEADAAIALWTAALSR